VEVGAALQARTAERRGEAEHYSRIAAQWEKIERLCRATGLPKGARVFPWLAKRRLIVRTPCGDLMFTPKASLDGKGGFETLLANDGKPARLSDQISLG
jgi:hypothetical protein